MTEFLPGTAIAGGRYRLLAWHGGRPRLQFWQAVDAASGQHVALTLVDPDGELPVEFVHEILARTVRLKGIGERGVARVLDVLHTGSFGVVVCEWIPGGTLRQIADTGPSPVAAATAMQFLAATAEEAHRAGLVLSVDHPSRLRVTTDGHVVLAFPASMLEATPRTDLRGIGCALYALLLNCWPACDVTEWAPAQFDSEGRPAEPCVIDPQIPFLVSTTVTGLLREEGGIASAATLLTLLRQAAADATDGSDCRVMPPLDVPAPGYYAGFRSFGPDEQAAAARRSVMRVGMSTAAAIIVVAVIALASSLNSMLGEHDDPVAMDPEKLGLNPMAPTSSAPQPEQTVDKGGERVQPAAASVFSPDGSPDSPEEAGAAIDNNPGTAWSTDRYYDADPFPKFKSGVGLLLKLEKPTPPGVVTVDLDCVGTVVQIRAAQSDQPKTLAETTELTPPTQVRPGQNRIPITDPAPVSNVLVWISKLGSADGNNRCAMSEVGLQAASPPA
ncbi:protein kinase family protein [Mycobacterium sp.]|uniref:protein kinase family protein n=1 Tax=Mycobacterium sp. TaxID=1785 RepID=UPI002DAA3556|nr:protein kinase family protein [Mycobacterium sp.]